MFKLIANLVIAILFSVAIQGQNNITGIWAQDKGSDYYTVILNNTNQGYIFTNFSFLEQDIVIENLIEETDDYVKSVIHNPENGWRVYCEYSYIDENNLKVKYSGDIEQTQVLMRQNIIPSP